MSFFDSISKIINPGGGAGGLPGKRSNDPLASISSVFDPLDITGVRKSADANQAADAQAQADQQAIAALVASNQQSRTDTGPYRQGGGYALDAYSRAMGLPAYNPADTRFNATDPMYQGLLNTYAPALGVDPSTLPGNAPSVGGYTATPYKSDGHGHPIFVDPTGKAFAQINGKYVPAQGGVVGPNGRVAIGADGMIPGYQMPTQASAQPVSYLGNGMAPTPNGGIRMTVGQGMPTSGAGYLSANPGATALPGVPLDMSGDMASPASTDRYGGFETSPQYNFVLDQALQGATRAASAGGYLPVGPGAVSGRFSKEMSRYAGGLASTEFQSYLDNLGREAGLGSNSTNNLNANTTATSGGVASGISGVGTAKAAGIMGSSNASSAGMGNLGNLGMSLLAFL